MAVVERRAAKRARGPLPDVHHALLSLLSGLQQEAKVAPRVSALLTRDAVETARALVWLMMRLVVTLHAEARITTLGPGRRDRRRTVAGASTHPDEMQLPLGRNDGSVWQGLIDRTRAVSELCSDLPLFAPCAMPLVDRILEEASLPDKLARPIAAALHAETEEAYACAPLEWIGHAYESIMGFSLTVDESGSLAPSASDTRWRMGAHYTPEDLCNRLVHKTLGPHIECEGASRTVETLVATRVCDPAMGSGFFLLAAARTLADALESVSRDGSKRHGDWLTHVTQHCLYGVDKDPLAVDLARISLWLLTKSESGPSQHLRAHLTVGNSLAGPSPERADTVPERRSKGMRFHLAAHGETESEPGALPLDFRLAFPEVWAERGGFDAVVGNPPFLGGKRISTVHGRSFSLWLGRRFAGANGNTDLSAYFFRLGFELLRPGGTMGFVATSSIAEGDTRASGLAWIRRAGGTLYDAVRNTPWPGGASVLVSTVCIRKGGHEGPITLDGRAVPRITSFLLDEGDDEAPARLSGDNQKAFIGCFLRGMGFTFDDRSAEATPLSVLHALRTEDPTIMEVVRPYLGGDEVLSHPRHLPHRYAINFAGLNEHEAETRWPSLMRIVRDKVKPSRQRLGTSPVDLAHKRHYWLFANDRPELRAHTTGLLRVLVVPRVSSELCAVFLPRDHIFSDQLVVFAFDCYASFAVVQSRVHEAWIRAFCSTLGKGLRYTPSDGFETFPLPPDWATNRRLRETGHEYYERREEALAAFDIGLTALYRRFHDPDEREPRVTRLRELHGAIDAAVAEAYGWEDAVVRCSFRGETGSEPNDAENRRRGRRSMRLRMDTPDAVLARLLGENRKRAAAR